MIGLKITMKPAAILAALSIGLSASSAAAEEVGEAEYLSSCASCHGVAGEGGGPMNDVLSLAVPSLTGLAAENDGVFPMLEVIQIIDGRTGVRGHGGDGMPVWGAAYKTPLAGEIGDYAAETAVRGRILSLALYLQSIQK